ncbi:hypothetical protein CDEST_04864 [Colletotrichum destructivum]|uniref:Uncharacterized protein n=1 Tax=Colletotrichum destructivum TaxID=34406 RepID=A0AAX4I935_9PEZI|nr:hypothetical protein CDEST_04864 [Colletotrichum destructivum]
MQKFQAKLRVPTTKVSKKTDSSPGIAPISQFEKSPAIRHAAAWPHAHNGKGGTRLFPATIRASTLGIRLAVSPMSTDPWIGG